MGQGERVKGGRSMGKGGGTESVREVGTRAGGRKRGRNVLI